MCSVMLEMETAEGAHIQVVEVDLPLVSFVE
jgi:hypothetical protein